MKRKQKGTAIVVALFVVALVAAITVAMITHFRMDVRRTQMISQNDQAYLYAQGSIAWAIDQLNQNWKQRSNDRLVDTIPIYSKEDKEGAYKIKSIILDAQGKFNINSIIPNSDTEKYFNRLVHIVAPELPENEVEDIVRATVDWITPIGKDTLFDPYYLQANPPYHAPHKPMASVSEFRLIKGVTAEIYNKMSAYIAALPEPTKININTAPAEILMSLSDNMTREAANNLVKIRRETPFLTLNQFSNTDIVKNNPIKPENITETSDYFLVQTHVTVDSQHLNMFTLLKRLTKNNQAKTFIVWQSFGTL